MPVQTNTCWLHDDEALRTTFPLTADTDGFPDGSSQVTTRQVCRLIIITTIIIILVIGRSGLISKPYRPDLAADQRDVGHG